MKAPLSNRGKEWVAFATKVLNHIENYAVKQYGDLPDDNVEKWTAYDCNHQIGKYAARFGSDARVGQDLLNCFKIAHYACLMSNKLNAKEVEPIISLEGASNEALLDEIDRRGLPPF